MAKKIHGPNCIVFLLDLYKTNNFFILVDTTTKYQNASNCINYSKYLHSSSCSVQVPTN